MRVTDPGMRRVRRLLQPENAPVSISRTDSWIFTDSRFLHLSNEYGPIVTTELGISMFSSAEMPNALYLISLMPTGRIASRRLLQRKNAASPISSTESGRITVPMVLSRKAELPTAFVPAGILTTYGGSIFSLQRATASFNSIHFSASNTGLPFYVSILSVH